MLSIEVPRLLYAAEWLIARDMRLRARTKFTIPALSDTVLSLFGGGL